MYVTIYLYVYCLSFGILNYFIIIPFPMMSLHIQAHKSYAKCYHSHLQVIQLRYISICIMEFADIYTHINIFIEIENKLTMEEFFGSVFLNKNHLVMAYLIF